MSERTCRLILGSTLLTLNYGDSMPMYDACLGLPFFESITNWRIPALINRMRSGQDNIAGQPKPVSDASRFNFETERAMCLVFALRLIPAIFFLLTDLWLVNWTIASFRTLAGLENFCPTAVTLHLSGFW